MSERILLADALRDATTALSAVSETPRLDAELLAAYGLQMDRREMLMRVRDLAAPDSFANMVSRRMAHEPVAYIIGTQAFWDIELIVTSDVLIPRADSETLIEAAQQSFAGTVGPRRILDLGTGSGALLLAGMSLFPDAAGTGIDASIAALTVAQDNADKLGFGARTKFYLGNWRSAGWRNELETPFDLVLCNPPYVESTAILSPMISEYEPHSALFAGVEGLDDYRILLPQILDLLAPAGIAIFEIGHAQAQSVGTLAAEAGLQSKLNRDLAGNPRCLTMRR